MKSNREIAASDATLLVARVLLGLIFVWFGVGKAANPSGTIASFAQLGLPFPPAVYCLTLLIEVGFGLLFMTGTMFSLSAAVLAVWCVGTAVAAHRNFADSNMLIQFFKNLSMCGGFLFAALAGPGALSVDGYLSGASRFRTGRDEGRSF